MGDPTVRTYIGPSQNEQAGNGLYAARDFEEGDWIADLTGDIVPIDELPEASVPYAFYWKEGFALDPLSTTVGSVGHIANSPHRDPHKRKANAKFAPDRIRKSVNLRATRKINIGEEILVNYGIGRTKRLN